MAGLAWAQQEPADSSSTSISKKRAFNNTLEAKSSISASTSDTRKKTHSTNTCELLATIHNDIITKIVEDINLAGKDDYIGIESPSFTNERVKNALISAAEKNAKIKIFVNDPTKENNTDGLITTYNNLRDKNITVIIIPNLHAKRIVILKNTGAPRIVYLGSLNMTQNSPYNIEIMMRCTDPNLFIESYGDQQRLGTNSYSTRLTAPVDFDSPRIINSFYPEAIAAKKIMIEDFATCHHPHDHLYFVTYTLDDPEFINAIIQAKQRSSKSITVILDSTTKTNVLRQLVLANIDTYAFNKNRAETTPQGFLKAMHIKAIFRQCNQECLSLISTANFTQLGKTNIDHDLWYPCSFHSFEQAQRMLEAIKQQSEKLNPLDYQPQPTDGTPQQMGEKILALSWCRDCIFDNTNEILRLIRAGADLSLTDMYGSTALIKATATDHPEIVQALLDAGANANQICTNPDKSSSHYTALQLAARSGYTQLVNLLIQTGITPTLNYTDQHGNTPLFMAINGNYVDIVKALLKAGANPNIPGNYSVSTSRWGHTGSVPPLVQAVSNLEIAQALIEAGAHLDATDREGLTAFLRATMANNIPMIQLLAHAGADINAHYPNTGKTALMEAITKGDIKLVTTLLSVGADISAQDRYRKTAFDHAAGKPQILNLLNDIKFARENLSE